ncbi:unnamed protein product, partial [Mesorhabditis spiculigera]
MANVYIKPEIISLDDDDTEQGQREQQPDEAQLLADLRLLKAVFERHIFKCNICPSSYASSAELEAHIRGRHSDDVVNQYLRLVLNQQEKSSLRPQPTQPPPQHRSGKLGHPCWSFFERIDRFDAMCLVCRMRVQARQARRRATVRMAWDFSDHQTQPDEPRDKLGLPEVDPESWTPKRMRRSASEGALAQVDDEAATMPKIQGHEPEVEADARLLGLFPRDFRECTPSGSTAEGSTNSKLPDRTSVLVRLPDHAQAVRRNNSPSAPSHSNRRSKTGLGGIGEEIRLPGLPGAIQRCSSAPASCSGLPLPSIPHPSSTVPMDGDTASHQHRPLALRPVPLPLTAGSSWTLSHASAGLQAAYQVPDLRPSAANGYDLFVDQLQQHHKQQYDGHKPYDYTLAASYDGVAKVFADDTVVLKTEEKPFDPHPHILVAPMGTGSDMVDTGILRTPFSFHPTLSTAQSTFPTAFPSTTTASLGAQDLLNQSTHSHLDHHHLNGQLALGNELLREQVLNSTQQLQHSLAQQQHHQIQLQAPSVIETRKSAEANAKGDGATPAKRGRPTENPCWNYFIRLDDQNVRCRICSKVVKSACATNMTKHLERHHQNDYQHLIIQIKQYRQQKVPQSVILPPGSNGCLLPGTATAHFVKGENPYIQDIYSQQQFDCPDALLRNYVDVNGHQLPWNRNNNTRGWSGFDGWANEAAPSTMADAWGHSAVPTDPTQPMQSQHDKPMLKRNRKTEHPVWEFFKRTLDGNAQCSICGGVVKSPCSSNFMRHLMRHHASEYNAVYVKWMQKRVPLK